MTGKVLLVEDDENKRQRVMHAVNGAYPDTEIVEARSLRGAEDALDAGDIALVILDMSIPMFDISAEEDGGSFQATGGQELLRYMKRYKRQLPVVVLTQFSTFGKDKAARTLEQIDTQLRDEFGPLYLGAIYYDTASDAWQRQLFIAISETLARWNK